MLAWLAPRATAWTRPEFLIIPGSRYQQPPGLIIILERTTRVLCSVTIRHLGVIDTGWPPAAASSTRESKLFRSTTIRSFACFFLFFPSLRFSFLFSFFNIFFFFLTRRVGEFLNLSINIYYKYTFDKVTSRKNRRRCDWLNQSAAVYLIIEWDSRNFCSRVIVRKFVESLIVRPCRVSCRSTRENCS